MAAKSMAGRRLGSLGTIGLGLPQQLAAFAGLGQLAVAGGEDLARPGLRACPGE